MASTLRSAFHVARATFLSRFLGVMRDALTAFFFGAGAHIDAFFLALLIPNLFRKLLGEGALSAALLPVLASSREKQNPKQIHAFISTILTLVTIILAVCTLLLLAFIWFIPPEVIGFDDPIKWQQIQSYETILSPMVLFLCVGGISAGILNSYGRFNLPALMPALQNAIWILGILIASQLSFTQDDKTSKLQILCGAILFGGLVQWLLQLRQIKACGIVLRPTLRVRTKEVKEVWKAFIPTAFALAIFQFNTLLDLLLAEWFVESHGAVSAYSYASRLFQFPLGLVAIALSTAIFPMLARHAAQGQAIKVTGGLFNGMRLLAFIVLPATMGLAVLSQELVLLTYGRGKFLETPGMLERTSQVLFFLAFALPLVCALQLGTKAFYALKDTKTPTRLALLSVVVNLGANLIFVQTPLKEAGLALGTACSSLFNLILLLWLLRRRLRGTILEEKELKLSQIKVSDRLATPLSKRDLNSFFLSLGRSCLASLIMGACVLGMKDLFPAFHYGGFKAAGFILGIVIFGMLLYFGTQKLMRAPELQELMDRSPS